MARKWEIANRTSDLYVGKSTLFKVFLVVGVLAISALFIWHTLTVIDKLQSDTRDQVEKYVGLWQLAANSPESGSELQFIFDEIIVKARFPIVVLDEDREPVSWRNIPEVSGGDTSAAAWQTIKDVAEQLFEEHGEYPLYFGETQVNYLRYGDSEAINQLRTMPFIAIGVVFAFMTVGMIGFQNIRRSEERYIWVGMAKETAHQLGTPLSALLGWLEVMSAESRSGMTSAEQEELLKSTTQNMRVDVRRLQRVANRFGLIGSIPELNECDLNDLVDEAVAYYRRRLPFEGQGIRIDVQTGEIPPLMLNGELFSWVLENLIKNSLQASDSKNGQIRILTRVVSNGRGVVLNVIDNGKGISVAAARKIFRPGFTTKKRGWGMGLTLVKRIVEEYHGGRITLARSHPGETVFEIILPISGGKR
ncbi:MAG: HAMP domain-containing histidine kinase [bacterium]|nr:HAMP domain-containing histidine kinase [bacterium]